MQPDATASTSIEEIEEDKQEAAEKPKSSQSFSSNVKLEYSVRFSPSFQLPYNHEIPISGPRIYASYKIDEISLIGLMTLKMSEAVVVHDSYEYVTLQDFEVEYKLNSDEEP